MAVACVGVPADGKEERVGSDHRPTLPGPDMNDSPSQDRGRGRLRDLKRLQASDKTKRWINGSISGQRLRE